MKQKMVYHVMLQEGPCRFLHLGIHGRLWQAKQQANRNRAQGRVQVRELQPYGPTVYDTDPFAEDREVLQEIMERTGTDHYWNPVSRVYEVFAPGVRYVSVDFTEEG